MICKWCRKELTKTTKKFCNSTCANKFRWNDPEFKNKTSKNMRKYYKEHPGCRNGENNSFYGKKHAEKTIIRLSKKAKERGGWTEYNREHPKPGVLNGMYGKHHTNEAKNKMRLANTGKTITEEHKNKIRLANLNKIVTEKTRKKLSDASLNRFENSKRKYKDTLPEKIYESFLKFSGLNERIDYFKQKNIENITRVDFYIPFSKTCIFIDGDYWHCNPKYYTIDYYHAYCRKTAREIQQKDKQVSNLLESKRYKVIRIWESDIKKEKLYVL